MDTIDPALDVELVQLGNPIKVPISVQKGHAMLIGHKSDQGIHRFYRQPSTCQSGRPSGAVAPVCREKRDWM